MSLRPFSEFLDSLSENDIRDIMGGEDKYNDLVYKLNHSDGTNGSSTYVIPFCYGMNLRLLERYHAWLSQDQSN